MERNILYVDSNEESREKLSGTVSGKSSLNLDTAGSIAEAQELMEGGSYRCLITDTEFEDGDLGELLDAAGETNSTAIPIVFSNSSIDEIPAQDVVNASAFVSKNTENAYKKLMEEVEALLQSRSEIAYPKPEEEDERLKALKKFDIDRLTENTDFDRLTALGSEVLDTKFCFVGLVEEEKEKFLSFHGDETEELERSCSICTFTINQDDVMEVEDREKDPRFKYIDELEDLGINWYAGVPLKTEDGYRIGAFCVADEEPRQLTDRERKILELLADEAMDKIRLEREANRGITEILRGYLWR